MLPFSPKDSSLSPHSHMLASSSRSLSPSAPSRRPVPSLHQLAPSRRGRACAALQVASRRGLGLAGTSVRRGASRCGCGPRAGGDELAPGRPASCRRVRSQAHAAGDRPAATARPGVGGGRRAAARTGAGAARRAAAAAGRSQAQGQQRQGGRRHVLCARPEQARAGRGQEAGRRVPGAGEPPPPRGFFRFFLFVIVMLNLYVM